jgi:hypothetical protein
VVGSDLSGANRIPSDAHIDNPIDGVDFDRCLCRPRDSEVPSGAEERFGCHHTAANVYPVE